MNAAQARIKTKKSRGQTAVLLLALCVMMSCSLGIPDYRLTVIVEDGVSGTPTAGIYTYKDQDRTTISINYAPIDTQNTVEVILNGGKLRYDGTGSFALYADGYELRARLIDLRGSWSFYISYADIAVTSISCTIIFSGNNLNSGTFTDSRGYSGTWTAQANVFTMTYSNWADYVLTGTVYDMSGTFTGESQTGTWSATRSI